jgi:glycolate oxidase iron-sulfur subunit
MLFWLFPHPRRLRLLVPLLWFYQATRLQWLLRRLKIVRALPERWRAMEELLPPVRAGALLRSGVARETAAVGPQRGRVGLLLGCVQRVFFPGVNAATARVLAAEGYQVIAPPEQGCCGALLVHSGHEAEAMAMARRLIDLFEREAVEIIVTNAAGCGSTLKQFGWLLRDDPQYRDRAQAFAAKCRDISEVLDETAPRATRHPLPLRVAYHDACHLQHAQGIWDQPRRALGLVPQLEIVEIPEAAVCCGSAGIYNLVEPGPARQLGDRKAQNLLATGAHLLVTSNPGCLLQIRNALARAGSDLPVRHFVEVIDASMRGVTPAVFRKA